MVTLCYDKAWFWPIRTSGNFQSKLHHNFLFIFARRRAAIPAHPTTPSATAESDGPPSHWTAIPDGSEYVRVHINTISDEYKKTERKFLETMEGSHHIIRIERVQNPDLWTLYTQ